MSHESLILFAWSLSTAPSSTINSCKNDAPTHKKGEQTDKTTGNRHLFYHDNEEVGTYCSIKASVHHTHTHTNQNLPRRTHNKPTTKEQSPTSKHHHYCYLHYVGILVVPRFGIIHMPCPYAKNVIIESHPYPHLWKMSTHTISASIAYGRCYIPGGLLALLWIDYKRILLLLYSSCYLCISKLLFRIVASKIHTVLAKSLSATAKDQATPHTTRADTMRVETSNANTT